VLVLSGCRISGGTLRGTEILDLRLPVRSVARSDDRLGAIGDLDGLVVDGPFAGTGTDVWTNGR
jgi:hypothetical protein